MGLTAYLVRRRGDGKLELEGIEKETCIECGREHDKLYRFFRKPAGMLGQFVTFRINGEVEAPDLSIPMRLAKMPRDAEPMSKEASAQYWHSE